VLRLGLRPNDWRIAIALRGAFSKKKKTVG